MADLSERVEELERFKYRALGLIHAQNTLLTDLWLHVIQHKEDALGRLTKGWLQDSDTPRRFAGVDAAELDLISQEYRDAMQMLVAEFLLKRRH